MKSKVLLRAERKDTDTPSQEMGFSSLEGHSTPPPALQLTAQSVQRKREESHEDSEGLGEEYGESTSQLKRDDPLQAVDPPPISKQGLPGVIQHKRKSPFLTHNFQEENPRQGIQPFQFKRANTKAGHSNGSDSSSRGQLPEGVQNKMESTLGADFSGVNIRTNSSRAKNMGALAFTEGNNVHFAPGQYKPDSKSGQELIGHELAHVVQQRKGQVKPTTQVAGNPVNDDPALEKSADELGRKAASADGKAEVSPRVEHVSAKGPVQAKFVKPIQQKKRNPESEEEQEVSENETTHLAQDFDSGQPPAEEEESNSTESGTEEAEKTEENKLEKEAKGDFGSEKAPNAVQKEAGQKMEQGSKKEASLKEESSKPETALPPPGKMAEQIAKKVQNSGTPVDRTPIPLPDSGPGISLIEVFESKGGNEQEESASAGLNGVSALPIQMSADPGSEGPEPVEIGPFQQRIEQNGNRTAEAIRQHGNSLREQANQSANAVRQQVDARFDTGIQQIRDQFTTKRQQITDMLLSLRATLESNFQAAEETIATKGEQSKSDIDQLFTTHIEGVDQTVNGYISQARELSTTSQSQFRGELQAQAGRARSMGQSRAGTYPSDERGQVQRDAVIEVANETAREIEGKIQENVNAVAEICDPLPEQFRERGEELKSSINDHRQPLYEQVDQQVSQTREVIRQQYESLSQQLNTMEQSVMAQLDAGEEASLATLEGQQEQAHQQLDDTVAQIEEHVNSASENAAGRIEQAQQEASQLLEQNSEATEESIAAFTESVATNFSQIQSEVVAAMDEGITTYNTHFEAISSAADTSVDAELQRTGAALEQIYAAVQNQASEVTSQTASNLEEGLVGFDTQTIEFHGGIQDSLDENLVTMEGDMLRMLAEAEAKVGEARSEGLAKNQEALNELPGKMTEAASDAAWRHDHPIRAALWDAVSFIGGLLVGILLVLVLVVVVIVAFKAIVAGLILIGFSALVAKIIVVVGALVLLGVMVFLAYRQRRSQGQGGWSAFVGALGDVTGISDIVRGFSEPGLSPFERGFFIGRGVATVATFIFGNRINNIVNRGLGRIAASARFPRIAGLARGINNPVRGGVGEGLRARYPQFFNRSDQLGNAVARAGRSIRNGWNRFRGRNPGGRNDVGLSNRGYRPRQGERTMTREQYREWSRNQRAQRTFPERVTTAQNRAAALEAEMNRLMNVQGREGPMQGRYQDLLDEIVAARNLAPENPDAAARALSRLESQVRVVTEMAHVRGDLANAGVNIRNTHNRNMATANYELTMGNHEPLTGNNVSVSGRLDANAANRSIRQNGAGTTIDGAEMTPNAPRGDRNFQVHRTNPLEGNGGHQDSEAKLFEMLLPRMRRQFGVNFEVGRTYPDVRGNFTLTSEMTPCSSCGNIIGQFRNMFPNVNVTIRSGVRYP